MPVSTQVAGGKHHFISEGTAPVAADDLFDSLLDRMMFTSAWLPLGLEYVRVRWFVVLEARVLVHQRVRRKGQSAFIGELLIMDAAGICWSQMQAATGQSVALAFVDQGYTDKKAAEAAAAHGIQMEMIKLADANRGFVLLPRRWVMDRSFA